MILSRSKSSHHKTPKNLELVTTRLHPPLAVPPLQVAKMAKKAKSRTIAVRLISMAMTGYYRTMVRPRTHRPLSMLKYDPVVKKKVLFLEATKGGRAKWFTISLIQVSATSSSVASNQRFDPVDWLSLSRHQWIHSVPKPPNISKAATNRTGYFRQPSCTLGKTAANAILWASERTRILLSCFYSGSAFRRL